MPLVPLARSGAPRAFPVRRQLAAAGLAAAALAACTDEAVTNPVGRPTTGTGTTAPGTTPSGTMSVARYFGVAMDSIQKLSINQAVASSPVWRQKYAQQAASATTYKETYPILRAALRDLDPHSGLYEPTNLPGSTDAPADRPDLRVQGRMLANNRVGYVWFPGFSGRSQAGRADTTHQVLRGLDASNPCGWIVDLRANNGGLFYGMMLSLGPLYASGANTVVGGQKYGDGGVINWYYRQRPNGSDTFGITDGRQTFEPFSVDSAWRPKRPLLPVAVLQSTARNAAGQLTSITASAGESIALAFKGGPPTRSFGGPTYGVASTRAYFFMPDSARIDVTSAYMFARTGYTPGNDPIPPDVAVTSPTPLSIGATDAVVTAAIEWLQSQPACTNASGDRTAAESPRLNVAPARTAPVPVPGPRGRLPGRDAMYVLPDASLRLH